ncbi:MAG: hypothetical protein JNL01_08150 [Bdellovibrionales bacterium]|nr:hypothetical protein [Bdellovibrionales bacterium]
MKKFLVRTSRFWFPLLASFLVVQISQARGAFGDELKIFTYSSPGIDWRDPNRLARTIVKNFTGRSGYPMGHVAVEVSCDATATEPAFRQATGMTDAKKSEARTFLLLKGGGLGALFHSFQGRMQSTDEVDTDNAVEKSKGGNMRYIAYDISASTCRRLATYLTEYRENKVYTRYGLPNSPRHAEGAGCSAFGVSLVELAGLLTSDLKAAWSMNIAAPAKLVGGPMTGKRVSLLSLLIRSKKNRRWAESGEAQFGVFFYEPDLIFKWIGARIDEEVANPSGRFEIERQGKVIGMRIDARNVSTPKEPIWWVQP